VAGRIDDFERNRIRPGIASLGGIGGDGGWHTAPIAVAAHIAAGVDKDEIAITRGATEAMQNLIVNYNRLQPGDSVLYADLDYDSMQFAMEWLKDRRGVGVFKHLTDVASVDGKKKPRRSRG
jgi:hypothetical protein